MNGCASHRGIRTRTGKEGDLVEVVQGHYGAERWFVQEGDHKVGICFGHAENGSEVSFVNARQFTGRIPSGSQAVAIADRANNDYFVFPDGTEVPCACLPIGLVMRIESMERTQPVFFNPPPTLPRETDEAEVPAAQQPLRRSRSATVAAALMSLVIIVGFAVEIFV